jgi:hypothetical protein
MAIIALPIHTTTPPFSLTAGTYFSAAASSSAHGAQTLNIDDTVVAMGPPTLGGLQPIQLNDLFSGELVPITRLSGPPIRLRTIVSASTPTAMAAAVTATADTIRTIRTLGAD